jgi:DMSO/TMAO reductase YedYZ heme-binding membrane subunit
MQKTLNYYNISIFISLIIFSIFAMYNYLFFREKITSEILYELNRLFALTGFVMIGISFAISGITYFTNFLDRSLLIRKNIGIVGFWLIFIHFIISFFFLSDTFSFNYYMKNLFSFSFALSSLILLAIMTVISIQKLMILIGPKKWRLLLRYLGYTAYLLGLIHFAQKNYISWYDWCISGFGSMPELNFIVFIFGIFIFLLRIFLWIKIKSKNEKLIKI